MRDRPKNGEGDLKTERRGRIKNDTERKQAEGDRRRGGQRDRESAGREREEERATVCLWKAGFCFHREEKSFFVIESLE